MSSKIFCWRYWFQEISVSVDREYGFVVNIWEILQTESLG